MEFLRGDENRYRGEGILYTRFPASLGEPDILATYITLELRSLVRFLVDDGIGLGELSKIINQLMIREREQLSRDIGFVPTYSLQFPASDELNLLPVEGDIINIGASTSKLKGENRLNDSAEKYFDDYQSQQAKLTYRDIPPGELNRHLLERFFVPFSRYLSRNDERSEHVEEALLRFSAGAPYEQWTGEFFTAVHKSDSMKMQACLEMIIAVNDDDFDEAITLREFLKTC